MPTRAHTTSTAWLELREHSLAAACPDPPHGCGAGAGEPCHLTGPPAHPHRLLAADALRPRPDPVVDDPPRPAPGRRLVSADRVRADLARHREPCRYCHRPVVWATNPAGDRVPVDADPIPPGTTEAALVTLHVDDRGPRSTRLTPGQIAGARAAGQRLHAPHRETCPSGHVWSRHRT